MPFGSVVVCSSVTWATAEIPWPGRPVWCGVAISSRLFSTWEVGVDEVEGITLNDFIAAHIAPAMKDGGFRKTGRRSWQIESSDGLKTNVWVSNYSSMVVSFHVVWWIVPRSIDDYFAQTGAPRAGPTDSVWMCNWPTPGVRRRPTDGLWDVAEVSEVAEFGRLTEREFRENAVPFWRSIDARVAADLVRSPREYLRSRGFGMNNSTLGVDLAVAMIGMYTEDPAEMLKYVDEAAKYDRRPIKDWVRAQLLARLEPDGTDANAGAGAERRAPHAVMDGGSFRVELLLRTITPLADIAALHPFEGWLAQDLALPGNWWRCSYDFHIGEDNLVTNLAAEIDGPVILGYVIDDTVTIITAAAPGLPEADVALGPTQHTTHDDQITYTVENWPVLPPQDALTHLLRWSALAGLTADRAATAALLNYDGILAGQQWDPLLAALGLPTG